MIAKPETRFTRAGSVAIAYQVVGDGPVDIVYAPGWLSNIDVFWESPPYAQFLARLARSARLILFDKRGTGMSDRDVGAPTLEERAEDIRAVMDAAGSERASLFGVSEGGNMAVMFAATYPERVRSLILVGCFPCRMKKPDWPHGETEQEAAAFLAELEAGWGDFRQILAVRAPSIAAEPEAQAFIARMLTQAASPSSALAITRLNLSIDIRPLLPAVHAPALVIHRRGDRRISEPEARYLAEALPRGRLSLHEGIDHLPWIGDGDRVADEILAFAEAAPAGTPEDRVLLTVLMTDLAGSTAHAARIGDTAWRDLIEAHDRLAEAAVARQGGTLVKTTGDGILATFAGPSRALAAAREAAEGAERLGLRLRAGVHTGECLRRGADVSGISVAIAARILEGAGPSEIRVSGTVRDLVVGSGLAFEALGTAPLKGVPGDWPLHRLLLREPATDPA